MKKPIMLMFVLCCAIQLNCSDRNATYFYSNGDYKVADCCNSKGYSLQSQRAASEGRDATVSALLGVGAAYGIVAKIIDPKKPLTVTDYGLGFFSAYFAACAATSASVGNGNRVEPLAAAGLSALGLAIRYSCRNKKSGDAVQ